MLTQERLKQLLHYDPETGVFTRLVSVKGFKAAKGVSPGWVSVGGYLCVCVDGRQYLAHRLAWLYTYGEMPKSVIDHIDRVKTNNAITNLRLASKQLNALNINLQANNTSGVTGVCRHQGKWMARIKINGVDRYLGRFDTIEDAAKARKNAEQAVLPVIASSINN